MQNNSLVIANYQYLYKLIQKFKQAYSWTNQNHWAH